MLKIDIKECIEKFTNDIKQYNVKKIINYNGNTGYPYNTLRYYNFKNITASDYIEKRQNLISYFFKSNYYSVLMFVSYTPTPVIEIYEKCYLIGEIEKYNKIYYKCINDKTDLSFYLSGIVNNIKESYYKNIYLKKQIEMEQRLYATKDIDFLDELDLIFNDEFKKEYNIEYNDLVYGDDSTTNSKKYFMTVNISTKDNSIHLQLIFKYNNTNDITLVELYQDNNYQTNLNFVLFMLSQSNITDTLKYNFNLVSFNNFIKQIKHYCGENE